jgi:hypothetical protein
VPGEATPTSGWGRAPPWRPPPLAAGRWRAEMGVMQLPVEGVAQCLLAATMGVLALIVSLAVMCLPASACAAVLSLVLLSVPLVRKDRWRLLRCHRWRCE